MNTEDEQREVVATEPLQEGGDLEAGELDKWPDSAQDSDQQENGPAEDSPEDDTPATTPATTPEDNAAEQVAAYAEQVADLSTRLHRALVAADGRLSDPADLPFNPEHLDNPAALEEAITALIQRKPGLAARQVGGDIGAGARGSSRGPVDLISALRAIQ